MSQATDAADTAILAMLKENGMYETLAAALGDEAAETTKNLTSGDVHQTSTGNGRAKPKKKPAAAPKTMTAKEALRRKRAPVIEEVVEKPVEFDFEVEVEKFEPEQRMVFGWASVSQVGDTIIVDKQNDIVPIDELEAGAYDFTLNVRVHGDMHTRKDVGRAVESMMFTPEKERLGIVAKTVEGEVIYGWWVGFKVDDDDMWADYKAGKRPEFSIGGHATKTEIVE